MPSILFINRVYPPESGATGRVLEQVAVRLKEAGWGVTVLTTAGEQSGPGAVVRDGVKVNRVGGFHSKSSLVARAAGYALMIPSLLIRALKLPRADVVVTMTDPPMLAVIGPIVRLLKGSTLVHWAQDLYPEVAEEAGVFKRGGIVAGVIRALSTASLKAHDLVVSVGRCMSERLSRRGIPPDRMKFIPNIGMEREIVPCGSGANPFRIRNAISLETLVVMYSGNLGRAHEFGTVLEAARLLRDQGEREILFLFVGEGPSRLAAEREATAAALSNVRFLPSQPGAEIAESLGAADLHLVTMRQGMSGLVVPSKFYGVMAAGRPCLFIGPSDSEVARVIREAGCGEVIGIGEGAKLALSIRSYRDESRRISIEGSCGLHWLRQQSDAGSQFLQCLGNQNFLSK
jgi:glycosyltransferase involved in cell wall biosynthesis